MGGSNSKEDNNVEKTLDAESLSDDNGSIKCEEASSDKCEPCQVGGAEKEAEAFCIECAEFLCEDCTRDHRKNKLTRKHIVLEGNDKPDDSKVFKTMKSMVSCQDHPEEEVAFKCDDDGKFICHKCFAVSHRKCEKIKELGSPSGFYENENESVRTFLKDKLRTLRAKTICTIQSKEKNVENLLEKQTLLKQERIRLIEHLCEIDEQLEKEVNALVVKETDALKNDIDICKVIEKEEIFNEKLLDNVLKSESVVWLSVVCYKVDKEADHLIEKSDELASKAPISLNFQPSPHFDSLKEITSIGEVQIIQEESLDEFAIDEKEIKLDLSSDAVE